MKATVRSFKKGDYLLHQNEDSRHMFVLNSGSIRVFRAEGDSITYYHDVGAGATVGEVALIDPGPRSASAVALEDVKTTVIYPEDVSEVNKNCPKWLQALARTLAVRTRSVLSHIERNPDKHIESSVIALLIYLYDGDIENITFKKSDFISECVDILRLTTNAVDNCLSELGKKDFLKITKSEIILEDIEELETYSEEVLKNSEDSKFSILSP